MSRGKKLKVAWICAFSNTTVREHLKTRVGLLSRVLRRLTHSPIPLDLTDKGVWNTNAIHEFESFEEVELHVIAPFSFLSKRVQVFEHNGIYYHFFRNEETQLFTSLCRRLRPSFVCKYKCNRRVVKRIIGLIKPDIVHLIGAENPQYSITLLDVPSTIPTIVQLQTLMSDPEFKSNYTIDEFSYKYRSSIERGVLQKADYIGSKEKKYKDIVKNQIKHNAKFLNLNLATGSTINIASTDKEFDFVYFASSINKACDLALEAFGIAHQQNPSISLDIVGGFDSVFKSSLDALIQKNGLEESVTFEGRLETHEDVLNQIRKARYALLPLKIDLVSTTIREAMANGLPVITTDTGEFGTQMLNKDKECVLIAPKGDHRALAERMLLIMGNAHMAEEIRSNAIWFIQKYYDNTKAMREWVESYKSIVKDNSLSV